MFLELLFASLAIMVASLAGVIAVWKQAGSYFEKNLNYFVSFAAGVFLVLVLTLAEEVLTHAQTLIHGIGWIVGGFAITFLITKFYPEGHHHGEIEKQKTLSAKRLIIGDSFHNIGDGILLAVAFSTSSFLGIVTAFSILFHEAVQEISEFFVLKKAGHSTVRALQINFLTASTILIGSVGGYFFLERFTAFEIPALGLAAGALSALLIQDLIPHSIKHAMQKGCGHKHIFAVVVGAVIMFSVLTVTAATHTHEHVDGHDDHAGEVHHEEIHENKDHDTHAEEGHYEETYGAHADAHHEGEPH